MSPPDFTKRNLSGPPPEFDPVTGAPLFPGPAAYPAVDPAQAYPSQNYPSQSYPGQGYPTAGYPSQGYSAAGPTAGYPAAGYSAQPYGPGYGPPGYQAAGPPPGYPAGYPPMGYQMVPMYPAAQRATKPGGATAAAVLAYVQSGFVLIGGVVMFSGSAGLDSVRSGSSLSSELTVIGIITVLAGGLLIAGATTLLNRKPALLLLGNALSIAVSLYIVVRLVDVAYGIGLWVPIIYAVLPIISIALASSKDVRSWARAGSYDQE